MGVKNVRNACMERTRNNNYREMKISSKMEFPIGSVD